MHFCPFLYIIKYNFMFAIISWCQHRSRIPGCTITCKYQCAAASPPKKKSPLIFLSRSLYFVVTRHKINLHGLQRMHTYVFRICAFHMIDETPLLAWAQGVICNIGHRISRVKCETCRQMCCCANHLMLSTNSKTSKGKPERNISG